MNNYILHSLKEIENARTVNMTLDVVDKIIKNYEIGKLSENEFLTILKACLEGVRTKQL